MLKRPALYALFTVVSPVGLNDSLLPSPLCPYPTVQEYAAARYIPHLMPQNRQNELDAAARAR